MDLRVPGGLPFLFVLSRITAAASVLALASVCISAARLPIKTYKVADGALRDLATRIRVDSYGFIWLCSDDGLSRYDGYTITNFTTAAGLPDRHVYDFLETRKGEFWLGTGAGLVRMNPKGSPLSVDNPLFQMFDPHGSKVAVKTLFEDADSTLWVGTTAGLYVLRGEPRLEPIDLGPLLFGEKVADVSSILRDRVGDLWVGTENSGLFRIGAAGKIEGFGLHNGLPGNGVASLLLDNEGHLWIGMRRGTGSKGGLARLATSSLGSGVTVERTFSKEDGLISDWVMSLFQARDGRIWAGTAGGLCLIENDVASCGDYRTSNGLCDYDITSLAEDGDGNIWLTSRCGTKKWSQYGFTSYSREDGLLSPIANSVFENSNGDLIVSDSITDRGVSRFDGKRFTSAVPRFPKDVAGFGWGWKQTVIQDSENDWWFPTAQGLFRFTGAPRIEDLPTAKPTRVPVGGRNPEIFRIFEDSRRDVWVAPWVNPKDLWRWERKTDRWFNHGQEAGTRGRSIDVTAFVEDRVGNLWIGTGSDYGETLLIRYRDGEFRSYSKNDNSLIAGWLRDLYVDDAGTLWIASTTSGLLKLSDPGSDRIDLVQYSTVNGLSSDGIYCVTGDRYGRIYAGSAHGIDRLDPGSGRVENFTTDDGLPGSMVEVAYRDRRGDLWFRTLESLARFVPEPVRPRTPPRTFISGFRVSGIPRPVSIFGEISLPEFQLEPAERQITIDFFGLGSNVGEKLKFEYRIAGGEWVPTLERSVNFGGLSPGKYVLEVRSITADGIVGTPATVPFSIAFPFWQRWWFLLLSLSVVISIAYLIYRARVARLLEMERVRTRIATDLHDDIGSNLSKISLLSEIVKMQMVDGSPENKRMLSTIAEASRSSVDSMSDIVWSINPDRDSVLELTRKMREYAEDMCEPLSIRVRFEPAGASPNTKLGMQLRREVLLIFKEAVNNAVRHSGCSELIVHFRVLPDEVLLTIEDDGCGFDEETGLSGNGLTNMKSRAARIGARFEMKTGAAKGTLVRVYVPN